VSKKNDTDSTDSHGKHLDFVNSQLINSATPQLRTSAKPQLNFKATPQFFTLYKYQQLPIFSHMKIIDKKSWDRKEHFDFYSNFDEPFFGLVAQVEVTKAYAFAKENNVSFFGLYLHAALVAANQIEALRYRLIEDKIVVFDTVHAAPTIGRKNGTFGFSFIPFHEDLATFQLLLKEEVEAVQQSTGLRLSENSERKDTVQFSSIPWANFTGLTHARHFKEMDSIPKISFGKMVEEGNAKKMSVAVFVNHAFADGFHVGRFLEKFQENLNAF
jgi:chloramphenicol O-acetyltransferase type A